MKPIDRLIFAAIALALMLIALRPLVSDAGKYADVNIAAVGGKRISFGEGVPVIR